MPLLLLEWPKSGTPTPPNAGEDVERQEPLMAGMQGGAAPLEDSVAASQKLNLHLQ